jgi:DNA-binding transcriptional LysR family regulator
MGKTAHIEIPWAELPIFHALAQGKTLSAAAQTLGVDRTTVARHIETLEAEMGRALFERLDGKFELTLLGRKSFAATERAFQELSVFGQSPGAEQHPLGKVRLSLPAHFCLSMAEVLARFQREHPDLLLELTATNRRASLQRYEADVALRLSNNPPPGMTKDKLGTVRFCLYRCATTPLDLTCFVSHPSAQEISPKIRRVLPDAKIVLSVDGFIQIREYIALGVGIGMLPKALGDKDARLLPVSPEVFEEKLPLWSLCLPEQKRLLRVQKLMRFLRREFKERQIV